MIRLPLSACALALLLAGCQGTTEPTASIAKAADDGTGHCGMLANPTVVRYHSERDRGTQHSVHLLNSAGTTARLSGCPESLPLASMVTLRYQVAGT